MSDRHEHEDRHGPERDMPEAEAPDLSAEQSEASGAPDDRPAPDDRGSRTDRADGADGTDGAAPGADLGGPGADPDPDPDEEALRRLLRESVSDLEPSPGSLEHLHRAVPARRARRRHMVVGAAAAVLLGGAAIPALLHTDLMPGRGDKPMHAAGHSQSQEPNGDDDGGKAGPDRQDGGKGDERNKGGKGAESSSPGSGGHTTGPDPSSTLGAVSPACTRDQLGQGEALVGQPDEQGRVYGSFRVANVSGASCTVEGDGLVVATAMGRADSDDIQVLDHTSGDAATGLPDPATAVDELVLKPSQAYVVRFAWIPREGGGSTGCSATTPPPGGSAGEGGDSPMTASGGGEEGGEGSPDDSTGGTGTTGGTGGDSEGGATGGDGSGGTGSEPGASISLSHTPDVGDPVVAGTVLNGACAGTIYRTGVLPAV